MSAPSLNRKLALQDPVRTPDGAGGWNISWVTLGTVWAEIRPTRGREFTLATLDVSRMPVAVTLRAAPVGDSRRPRADQRFAEDDRIYRILAVRDLGPDAHYLECLAEEEDAS